MLNKKTLIIDIDDTIINFGPHWIHCLNKRYGTNVSYDDIKGWDVSKYFPMLTREQVYGIISEPDFFSGVSIKYDAYYYMKLLKEEGYRLVICSSSSYMNLKNKIDDCVLKWFDFLHWSEFVICLDKSLLKGDVMIDDGPHNQMNFDGVKIMLDMPHNQDDYISKNLVNSQEEVEIANSIHRVYNWKEIYELVHKECPIDEK